MCGGVGRLEVDHRVPEHAGGSTWSEGNLQALCRGCHIQKTRKENSVRTMAPDQRAWLDYEMPSSAGSLDSLGTSSKRASS